MTIPGVVGTWGVGGLWHWLVGGSDPEGRLPVGAVAMAAAPVEIKTKGNGGWMTFGGAGGAERMP